MAISKFEATCLAVLEQVLRTGIPLRITRRGVPIADVVPPGPPDRPAKWLGAMAERGRIGGDILGLELVTADERLLAGSGCDVLAIV